MRFLASSRKQIALTRHHGGGDGAGVAFDDAVDAQRERVAHAIHIRKEAQRPRRGIGRRHGFDSAERIADRADPREISVARKIIAARQRRMRRRHEPRLQRDEVARREIRFAARRQPHARRNDAARQALRARDAQDEARAAASQIELLDEACQFADPDARRDRRGDARRAPGARRKSGGDEGERKKERLGASVMTRHRGEQRGRAQRAEAKRQRRFAFCGEVKHDAGAGGDGEPEERTAQRALFLQRRAQGGAKFARAQRKGARREIAAALLALSRARNFAQEMLGPDKLLGRA